LHPSGVAKSSTSFGWGKGGKVTSGGWQVTLCDLIWHVISRSGVVISITNCYIRFTLLYTGHWKHILLQWWSNTVSQDNAQVKAAPDQLLEGWPWWQNTWSMYSTQPTDVGHQQIVNVEELCMAQ